MKRSISKKALKAMQRKEQDLIQGMLDLAKTHKPTKAARDAAAAAHMFVLEYSARMLEWKGQQYYMDALGLVIEGMMRAGKKQKPS